MAAISASHLPYWWTGRRKVHTLKWGGEVTKTCENCPLGQQTIYNPFGNKQSSPDSCSKCAEGTWNKWRYEDEVENDPVRKNYKCVGCPGNQTTEFRGSSDPLDCIDCPAPPGKISWAKWEKTLTDIGAVVSIQESSAPVLIVCTIMETKRAILVKKGIFQMTLKNVYTPRVHKIQCGSTPITVNAIEAFLDPTMVFAPLVNLARTKWGMGIRHTHFVELESSKP